MAVRCPRCSRANPPGAAYCYLDGMLLGQAAAAHADPARQRVPMPFVFPSGRTCHTFDELVLACTTDWKAGREVLREGALAGFLNGLGRIDLARAARQAQGEPDGDVALNDLIRRLPSTVYKPARPAVAPATVNLGLLAPGKDVVLELTIQNLGMGLLTGSVASSADWLFLGKPDAPDRKKLFQCLGETVVPFHIPVKRLRAGNKPFEGELVVETPGGQVSVPVLFSVPVKPYPDGVLVGATTPRQVAEKAKEKPVEAGEAFASGAVQRWYVTNGWDYPVQEPAASGVAAVQQFFEALGLTKPPKVTVNRREVFLSGRPGERIVGTVQLATEEKRPIWAAVACEADWLDVRGIEYERKTATIELGASRVPNRPGELLEARVTLTTNGRVKYPVTVRLDVTGTPGSVPYTPAPTPNYAPTQMATIPSLPPDPVTLEPIPPPRRDRPRHEEEAAPEPAPTTRLVLALIPLMLVLIGLTVPVVRDLMAYASGKLGGPDFGSEKEVDLDSLPLAVDLQFHDKEVEKSIKVGFIERKVRWPASMRFGLSRSGAGTPELNRLTYHLQGHTNNTVVKLDDAEYVYGEQGWINETGNPITGARSPGRWKDRNEKVTRKMRQGRQATWSFEDQKVEVTQTVGLVAGDQSSQVDTCLVLYRMTNNDSRAHSVGVRVMLDTFIGNNDGVPFLVPGREHLISTMDEFRREDVPDFIQAFEREDFGNTGTVCRLGLRLAGLESPKRVLLGAWPDGRLGPPAAEHRTLWEVPLRSMKTINPPDSAITVYWDARELEPGASREVGFTYGLGKVSGTGGQLALTVGGSIAPGGEFSLTAYVRDPGPGTKLNLTLPEGFALVQGETEMSVPPLPGDGSTRISPVTWRIKGGPKEGKFDLKVKMGAVEQTQPVLLKARGLFSG
jgi:hypothetical protein